MQQQKKGGATIQAGFLLMLINLNCFSSVYLKHIPPAHQRKFSLTCVRQITEAGIVGNTINAGAHVETGVGGTVVYVCLAVSPCRRGAENLRALVSTETQGQGSFSLLLMLPLKTNCARTKWRRKRRAAILPSTEHHLILNMATC